MIDKDEAIRLLRKEVANKGADYVYENPNEQLPHSCYYFWNDQPSCIVGHVLADSDESYVTRIGRNTFNAASLYVEFPNEITEHASDVFQTAQMIQDNNGTWGQALARAENTYRELGGTE